MFTIMRMKENRHRGCIKCGRGPCYIEHICGAYYCSEECQENDSGHDLICHEDFHIRVRNLLKLRADDRYIVDGIRDAKVCVKIILSKNKGHVRCNKLFEFVMFPQIPASIRTLVGCLICGFTRYKRIICDIEGCNFQCVHKNVGMNDIVACSTCEKEDKFICKYSLLPSDKCFAGNWCKELWHKWVVIRYLTDMPTDILQYVFKILAETCIDVNRLNLLNIAPHICDMNPKPNTRMKIEQNDFPPLFPRG